MRRRLHALSLAALLATVACGDDGGGDDLELPDAAIEDLVVPDELRAICSPGGAFFEMQRAQVDLCLDEDHEFHFIENFFSDLQNQRLCEGGHLRSLYYERASIDRDAASECLAFLESATCEDVTTAGLNASACGRVFVGAVEAGGACGNSSECESGLRCDIVPEAPCGTCKPLKGAGESCDFGTECASAFCEPNGSCADAEPWLGDACVQDACGGSLTCNEGVCSGERSVAQGDACDPEIRSSCNDLFTRLRCDGATSTCVPYPTVGENCSDTFSCLDPLTQYCNAATMTCASTIDVAGEGDACEADILGTRIGCDEGLECVDSSPAQLGLCRPEGQRGDPCVDILDCGFFLTCHLGTCEFPGGLCRQ